MPIEININHSACQDFPSQSVPAYSLPHMTLIHATMRQFCINTLQPSPEESKIATIPRNISIHSFKSEYECMNAIFVLATSQIFAIFLLYFARETIFSFFYPVRLFVAIFPGRNVKYYRFVIVILMCMILQTSKKISIH